MKRILVALLVAVTVFYGCKKDKDDDVNTHQPVALKATYKPYEVAEIRYPNSLSTSQPLMAEVSGKEVRIAVIDDSTLGVLVLPEVFSQGGNNLTFTDGGKELAVSIILQAGTGVTDAGKSFSEYKMGMQEDIDFMESLRLLDTTGIFNQPEMMQAMAAAKQGVIDIDNAWNELDASNKLIMANVLAANEPAMKEITTNLRDLASSMFFDRPAVGKTTTREWCSKAEYPKKWPRIGCFGKEFATQTGYLVKHTGLVVGTVLTTFFGIVDYKHLEVALGRMVTSATNVYYIGYQFLNWRINVTKAHIFGKSTSKTTADVTFSNNEAQDLPISLTAQTVQSSDAGSSTAWIKDLIGAVNNYNAFCDKYPKYFSKFKLNYVSLSPVSIGIDDLSEISVAKIDNPNVKFGGVSGTAASPKIMFTTEATTDQTFNFDVTYNDGVNPPMTATISGIVKGSTFSLTGIWTIDLVLGAGVCDETLLEDEAGIPPTFHFNVDGTITFDTDPTGSDLNGPGYTNTYTYSNGTLTIKSHYIDAPDDNIKFEASLVYDQSLGKFTGTYTNVWTDNTVCTNQVTVYK